MHKHRWMLVLISILVGVLLVSACSNKEEEQSSENKTSGKIAGGENAPQLKEADNIPKDEKEALLAVVDQYFQAFNEKDLDKYMDTLSKNSESFQFDEEKKEMKKIFAETDIKMKPAKVVITDYKNDEANVYTIVDSTYTDPKTNEKIKDIHHQIDVFTKEDGKWKMKSKFVMESKDENKS